MVLRYHNQEDYVTKTTLKHAIVIEILPGENQSNERKREKTT